MAIAMQKKPDFQVVPDALSIHRFSYNHNRAGGVSDDFGGCASEEKSLKGRVAVGSDDHHIRFDFLLII